MAWFQAKDKAVLETVSAAERNRNGFVSPSQLDPNGGILRVAVLSPEPLTGFQTWFEKAEGGVVSRSTPEFPDAALLDEQAAEIGGRVLVRDGKNAISAFVSFFGYDYEADCVRVVTITQKTIIKDLNRLTSDDEYGDLSAWDLEIVRNGKGMETKYSIAMKPTKRKGAMEARVAAAWNEALENGADLGLLFTTGNPYGNAR